METQEQAEERYKKAYRRQAFDKLRADVRAAIKAYDGAKFGDHLRHEHGADCIRCNLERVLNGELR